ncbi:Tryp_alpha_amyl domain-containing protein [Cephalotus follicularis]|uniref:Tryp_alpha_amyl domain-containing protein n=1 Tax=Cephalotus follicularis TaxID=3775 RepID=A0A1Q3D9C5_CEPFO|nr:Tryp_alpha_amyl domain-containing protein [Cephalotus follicularis]
MASKASASLALFFSLNILIFASASNPSPSPSPSFFYPYIPKPSTNPTLAPSPSGPPKSNTIPTPSPSGPPNPNSTTTPSSSGTPKPNPSSSSCPKNFLKLEVCVKLLSIPVITIPLEKRQCCPLLEGLLDLEVGVCLCTAIKANVLVTKLNVPIALSLILLNCGKKTPPGFQCP